MSINYVSMIMYDMQMETKEDIRKYTRFRKHILYLGYYQLQASIYIKNLNNTARIATMESQIQAMAPERSHIRMMTMTQSQFKKMKIISGEESLSERIVKKETPLLEF